MLEPGLSSSQGLRGGLRGPKGGVSVPSSVDPVDDLILMHGAVFEIFASGDASAWRKAWTMRWLQVEEDFYADGDLRGLRLNAARVRKLAKLTRSDVAWPRPAGTGPRAVRSHA